jgi:hypothetical protein
MLKVFPALFLILTISVTAALYNKDGGDSQQQHASKQQHVYIDSEAKQHTAPSSPPAKRPGENEVYPEVWFQASPGNESFEFKVNCSGNFEILETCFLWDLDEVVVTRPDGETFDLNKDFNIQEFSGEVTRRWVLYGEKNKGLPESGTYVFSYYKDGEIVKSQEVEYEKTTNSYPTNVKWERRGADLYVSWEPQSGASKAQNYKAIIWNQNGTPEIFVSKTLDSGLSEGLLEDVPFIVGGAYQLNIAIFFNGGYAYSEYIYFEWPGE